MPKQRSNFISYLTLILAAAAFINSWLPNSPTAFGAPNRQDATSTVAQTIQTETSATNSSAQANVQETLTLQGVAITSTVPTYIGYQGVLRDAEGKLITKPVTVTFRIYENVTTATPPNLSDCKATNPCKWAEVHKNVTIRDGRFSVLLGNVSNPITPTLITSPDRFVGVQVEGYQEMQPRQRFSSVPYAMWSERAAHANTLSAPDGNPIDAVYVNNAGLVGIGTTNPQSSLHIMDGALGGIAIGDGTLVDSPNLRFVGNQNHWNIDNYNGSLRFFTEAGFGGVGGVGRVTFDANGSVGIGTAEPQAKLHIAGSVIVDEHLQMAGTDFVMGPNGRGGGRAMVLDGGDTLVLNYQNDLAGGTVVGSNLNVNGNFSLHGVSPVRILRYQNMGNDANIDTKLSIDEYNCLTTGWNSGSFDHPSGYGTDAVWTYFNSDTRTWWVQATFHSFGGGENPTVDVVCFRTEISNFTEYINARP